MNNNTIQLEFFQQVKSKMPPHVSLVDEVAELLGISNDSAYRRIRGEIQLALNELQMLSLHFKVSIDQLMGLKTNSIVFFGNLADNESFDFAKYLIDVLDALQRIEAMPRKEIYFEAKDIPIFHYFQFPYLAAFKYFFWQRIILQDFRLGKKIFEPEEFLGPIADTGLKVTASYSRIACKEIWSYETTIVTMNQIEFCYESGMFKSKESLLKVYDELLALFEHLEHEAEIGEKHLQGSKPGANPNNFQLYINDVLLGHNTIMVDNDLQRFVSLNHNVLNFLITYDKQFSDYTFNSLNNIIRKSNLISIVNEKERSKFFNTVKEKMTARKIALR